MKELLKAIQEAMWTNISYIIVALFSIITTIVSECCVQNLKIRKWIVCSCSILAVTLIFFSHKKNTIIFHEDFSLPFIDDYEINFDMTKSDLLHIIHKNNETELMDSFDNRISIDKEWNGISGFCTFFFYNEKMVKIRWVGEDKHKLDSISDKDRIFFQLEKNYGKKKKLDEKWNYCWENTKYFIITTKIEKSYLTDFYYVNWFEPNYYSNHQEKIEI